MKAIRILPLLLLFFCFPLYSSVPKKMMYQGVLTDSSGSPLTQTVNIEAKIYDALSGGNTLWTETHSSVSVDSGFFSIILGDSTALNLSFDQQYYIGVAVGSDSEMTPRQALTTAAYAFNVTEGAISSTQIENASIINADISTTAAIAFSKLASLSSGYLIVGSASGTPTAVPLSGDATLSSTGELTLANNSVSESMLETALQSSLAKSTLNNLSSLAINTSLLSDADNTDDLGSAAKSWKDLYIDGTANLATVDINAGTIDGTAIGSAAASTASVTTLAASGLATLNAGLTVGNGSSSAGNITLKEDSDDGSNQVTLQASPMAADYTLTLPADDGTANQVLQTDGSGSLSWATVGGASGANPALDNLSSVAINTSLLSDTDNTDDLGSIAKSWKDLYIDGTANMATVDINAGAIDGTAIGSALASTASVTTLAASGLTTLNAGLTVGHGATSAGNITLNEDTDDGINKVVIQASAMAADYTLTLPANDGAANQVLRTNGSGTLSWASGANAALDNLSSVAINTSLLSDTDNTDDLGSVARSWKDLYIDGTANLATVDINAGAIDGTAIGSASASTASVTTLAASGLTTLNAGLTVGHGATSAGNITLNEDSDNGTNKVVIQASAMAADYTLTLPADDGTANQVLQTDGSGTLSWAASGGGASVGARAYASGTTSLGGSWTQVALATEDFDIGGDFATNQFTAPSAGYYLVTAKIHVDNAQFGGIGQIEIGIRKNGVVPLVAYDKSPDVPNATYDISASVSSIIQLNTSDTLQLVGLDTTGSSVDVMTSSANTFMSVFKLGQ